MIGVSRSTSLFLQPSGLSKLRLKVASTRISSAGPSDARFDALNRNSDEKKKGLIFDDNRISDKEIAIESITDEIKIDSKTKWVTTFCLGLANFLACSAYTSIAPFYPGIAVERNVPKYFIGIIFAGYAVSMLIFSPFIYKLMERIGRKKTLMVGLCFETLAMISTSQVVWFNDEHWHLFAFCSFMARFLEGFGNTCINSCVTAIIATEFDEEQGRLIGITQVFTGLGLLAGPLLGAQLFSIGGFMAPYLSFATCMILLQIPIWLYVRTDGTQVYENVLEEIAEEDEDNEKSCISGSTLSKEFKTQTKDITLCTLLKHFQVVSAGSNMMMLLLILCFFEPLLQIRCHENNMDQVQVGYVFSIESISYLITSIIMAMVPDKKKNYLYICALGIFIMLISQIFMGPIPQIVPSGTTSLQELNYIYIGLLILGAASGLLMSHSVPCLNQIVKTLPYEESDKLKQIVSSIITFSFAVGCMVGGVLSSVLSDFMAYRNVFEVSTGVVLPVCIMSIVSAFCYNKKHTDDQSQIKSMIK